MKKRVVRKNLSSSLSFLYLALSTSALLWCRSTFAFAIEVDKPKWEAGAGFGYLGFEHYPASNQHTDLVFPFPTFQYRGEILRADDRDGAKLFVVKRPGWLVQLGGLGFPPLSASTNEARRGMNDLPLLIAIGPQLQRRLTENLAFKIGVYQAIAARLISAQTSGSIWEIDMTYRETFELAGNIFDETTAALSINLVGASREVSELYFSVPAAQITPIRASFEARAGLMQSQISYFQSFKRGDLAFYLGLRISDHRLSANRDSPLHRSDQNISGLIGLTYSIYHSKKSGISYENASGIVDKLRPQKTLDAN
jgi:hypothetical protein